MRAIDSLFARVTSFSLIGILNTVVGSAVIVGLTANGVNVLAANAAGYAVGLGLSYLFNSRITFRGRGGNGTAVRFLIAFLLAFTVNMLVVLAADAYLALPDFLRGISGVPAYVVTFYLLSERWVFRREC